MADTGNYLKKKIKNKSKEKINIKVCLKKTNKKRIPKILVSKYV